MGKSIALTAKIFGFRPSHAVEIYESTAALIFDTIAAVVVTEVESQSYRRSGSGSQVTPMSWDKQKTIAERIKKQEQIAMEHEKKRKS